jgi:hypothetical protein
VTLDDVIARLREGAEVRALADDGGAESEYHLIVDLGHIAPIQIVDLIARGLLGPEEPGRWRYTLPVTA